eukprot:tig00000802_g4278.t1
MTQPTAFVLGAPAGPTSVGRPTWRPVAAPTCAALAPAGMSRASRAARSTFQVAGPPQSTWIAGDPLRRLPRSWRTWTCSAEAPGQAAGDLRTPERIQHIFDVLRRDLPAMFERDVDYSIYDESIEFRDPVNKFSGMEGYRTVWWTLRYHAKYFTELGFELRELESPAPDTVLATWTLQGTLLLPWKPKFFFNGESTYKLNEAGLVYDHEDWWDRPPLELLAQFLPFRGDPAEKAYPLRKPRGPQ